MKYVFDRSLSLGEGFYWHKYNAIHIISHFIVGCCIMLFHYVILINMRLSLLSIFDTL